MDAEEIESLPWSPLAEDRIPGIDEDGPIAVATVGQHLPREYLQAKTMDLWSGDLFGYKMPLKAVHIASVHCVIQTAAGLISHRDSMPYASSTS